MELTPQSAATTQLVPNKILTAVHFPADSNKIDLLYRKIGSLPEAIEVWATADAYTKDFLPKPESTSDDRQLFVHA